MRIGLCLALARVSLSAAINNREFVPTSEWQFVPENVAIPAGLEIRMDLSRGGSWARIPGGAGGAGGSGGAGMELTEVGEPLTADLAGVDLDALEEKAPGYDDGAEIAREYGDALIATFADAESEQHEQAGRILGICLRNNADAARVIAHGCPELPEHLRLERRSLLVASALVSTQEGLALAKRARLLERLRHDLAGPAARELDGRGAAALRTLVVNLAVAGEDGPDMCRWADALQQAAYTTGHAVLRDVAREIVEHTGEFAGLTVRCAPQPGLLPVQHEAKRAAETAARLANPKARRNHFDEL